MQVYRLDLPGEEGRCVEEQMVLLEPAALAGRMDGFSRTLRKGTQLSAHSLDAPRGEVALVFTHVPAADALLAWNKEVATNVLVRPKGGCWPGPDVV